MKRRIRHLVLGLRNLRLQFHILHSHDEKGFCK